MLHLPASTTRGRADTPVNCCLIKPSWGLTLSHAVGVFFKPYFMCLERMCPSSSFFQETATVFILKSEWGVDTACSTIKPASIGKGISAKRK